MTLFNISFFWLLDKNIIGVVLLFVCTFFRLLL